MKSILILTILSALLASCQSHNARHNSSQANRSIANTRLFSRFIDDIARQTNRTSIEIEEKIVQYLKTKEKNLAHGNWSEVGISKVQADDLKSLHDDVPHITKIQKWVTENITKVIREVKDDMAAKAYNLILKETKVGVNPYTFGAENYRQLMMNRRALTTPYESINQKGARIFKGVAEVKDQTIKKVYMENYVSYSKAGHTPELVANSNEILDSALEITKITRRPAMGSGCPAFQKNSSFDILEMKANIDIRRTEKVRDAIDDLAKQGKKVENMTAKELDDVIDRATVESFEDVLGYTRVEAQAAVKRLKGKPCQVY